MAGYYRKFVKGFAKVSAPVLTLLDGRKPFTLYTDTCEVGLGAVFDARGKGDMQKAVGTQLCLSIAYHPQTDGQIERVNRKTFTISSLKVNNGLDSKWVSNLPRLS